MTRGAPPPGPGAGGLWRRLADAQDAALAVEDDTWSARGVGVGVGVGAGATETTDAIAGGTDHDGDRTHAATAVPGLDRTREKRRPRTSRRRLPRPSIGIGLGLAAATIALFAIALRKPALRVQVGSAIPAESTAVTPSLVADARADLPLRFSDGSTVTFRAGSSGRLLSLTDAGAELVLARGALEAHVIHAASTSWIVHAGPYRVRVTGTRFGVSWRSDKLELSLYEGSVIVDGAVLGAGVPLLAGRRLTVASGVVLIEPFTEPFMGPSARATGGAVPSGDRDADDRDNLRDREAAGRAATGVETRAGGTQRAADADRGAPAAAVSASDRSGTVTSVGAPTVVAFEAPTGSTRASNGAAAGARLSSTSVTADETWLVLAERGAYPEALAAARRIGWSSLCKRLDAHRLLTLADVARYSGARGPARRAFESLARRFPHDRLAADAVFSLGRLAFEAGRPTEAAGWFQRYGTEWPNGPLAEQAAGRLVESAIRMEDTEAARAAARVYLARAPHGPQAALARGVLADPSDGSP